MNVIEEYILINYEEAPRKYSSKKTVFLTTEEAASLNRVFALNGETKRYVLNDGKSMRRRPKNGN